MRTPLIALTVLAAVAAGEPSAPPAGHASQGGPSRAAAASSAPPAAERSAPSGEQARFAWPLDPEPSVLRPFDPPDERYGPGHRGVDLRAGPGQPVLAAGHGVVVFAGPLAGRGVVSVEHDGGLRTTYEPVLARVVAGDQVYSGQELGVVLAGHAGCAGPCLHWGVRRGQTYLDPLALVGGRPTVRLKPWDE